MKELVYEAQLDEYGNEEVIDVTVFTEAIVCSANPACSNIRYLKPQDKKQVTLCKPCARKDRLSKRAIRAKKYRKQVRQDIPE
jgi:ssDNA-binding Zn-finger/Zn-ribbon topoisomerase 1